MAKPYEQMTDEELDAELAKKNSAVQAPSKPYEQMSDAELDAELAKKSLAKTQREPFFGESTLRGIAKNLPVAGAMTGGALGVASPIPFGGAAGSALGAIAGKSLQNTAESLMGDEKTQQDAYLEPLKEGGGALLGESVGPYIGKAIGGAVEKTGEFIYKAGLPRLTDSIKNTLYGLKATGNKLDLAARLDNIAQSYESEIDDIARKATDAGGKVSMDDAMKPAIDMINELKVNRDPQLQSLARSLEDQVNKYTKLPNDYGSIGIKSNVPTTTQGIGYKRTLYDTIPEKEWGVNADNPAWVAGQKALSSGMKKSTEESVRMALGPNAEKDLIEKNMKWGDLIEAVKYLKKGQAPGAESAISPYDIGLGISSVAHPGIGLPMIAVKKLIEHAPLSVGAGMSNAAPSITKMGSEMISRAIQAGIAPWAIDGMIKNSPLKLTDKAQLRNENAKAVK